MAVKEVDTLVQRKNDVGELELHYFITRFQNVLGLPEAIADIIKETGATNEEIWEALEKLESDLSNKANLQAVENAAAAAANAQSVADAAKEKSESAESTANTAKSTADGAKTTAETAKSTADTAKSTADTAKTDASTAKSMATAAQTTANAAMPKAGGTFTGQVYAADSSTAAKRVRNIQLSTSDPGAGSTLANGVILLVYET